MPEISRFLGIVIAMFYSDHAPPHFHARYGEHEVTVRIDNGAVDAFRAGLSLSSSSGMLCTARSCATTGNGLEAAGHCRRSSHWSRT